MRCDDCGAANTTLYTCAMSLGGDYDPQPPKRLYTKTICRRGCRFACERCRQPFYLNTDRGGPTETFWCVNPRCNRIQKVPYYKPTWHSWVGNTTVLLTGISHVLTATESQDAMPAAQLMAAIIFVNDGLLGLPGRSAEASHRFWNTIIELPQDCQRLICEFLVRIGPRPTFAYPTCKQVRHEEPTPMRDADIRQACERLAQRYN